MAANAQSDRRQFWTRWRLAAWGTAAGLILLPLLAMQFTSEVKWGPEDFGFAIAMVVGIGVIYELAARVSSNRAYRVAVGIALAAAFLLIWANAAVGIIGSEDNAVNLWFDAVPAIGLFGAAIARFRAREWRVQWPRRRWLTGTTLEPGAPHPSPPTCRPTATFT